MPAEQKKKRILKNEDNLRDFWDNIKLTFTLQLSKKEKREKGAENLCGEIIAEIIAAKEKEKSAS